MNQLDLLRLRVIAKAKASGIDSSKLSLVDYAQYRSTDIRPWYPWEYLRHAANTIQEAIEKGGGRLIINMPPRHGKSELLSYYLPAWFMEKKPSNEIILTSNEANFAAEFGARVRDLVNDSKDCRVKIKEDKRASNRWITTHDGGMRTAGVGGSIIGRGGDLLIIDDPHKNWQEATSKTYQDKVVNWYKTTFSTRAEPNATIIIIMQRWCQDDLCGYLLNNDSDDWTLIKYPAIAEEKDALGREIGDPLCPERYPVEELLKKKQSMGTSLFEGMYQQNPAPPGGVIFKREWWKYYTIPPEDCDQIIHSWDMSFKETKNGSFVCGQVWGKRGADYYLVPPYQIRARMDFVASQAAVKSLYHLRKPSGVLIEDKANGPAIIASLKREISGIIPISPQGSKEARAYSVSPICEAGNVYLPDPSIWDGTPGFVEEHANFRGVAKEVNDQVDTFTQAINWFMDRNKKTNFIALCNA